MAATSTKRAGKVVERIDRAMVTRPVLQRLPQHLDAPPRELRQLVEEQHPVLGTRYS